MLLSVKCNLPCSVYNIPFVKINRKYTYSTHRDTQIYAYVFLQMNRIFLAAYTNNPVTVFFWRKEKTLRVRDGSGPGV